MVACAWPEAYKFVATGAVVVCGGIEAHKARFADGDVPSESLRCWEVDLAVDVNWFAPRRGVVLLKRELTVFVAAEDARTNRVG